MDHTSYPDAYISTILRDVKTIAVVGASAKTVRPSFFVVKYLLSKGYDVIPINPGLAGQTILEQPVFGSLETVNRPIHMVDIFRNSEAALQITRDVLALDPLPKVIWMQLSVMNEEAARLAEEKGVRVVMNRCPKIEYARLSHEIGWAGVRSGVISARRPKLQKGYQRFGIVER